MIPTRGSVELEKRVATATVERTRSGSFAVNALGKVAADSNALARAGGRLWQEGARFVYAHVRCPGLARRRAIAKLPVVLLSAPRDWAREIDEPAPAAQV